MPRSLRTFLLSFALIAIPLGVLAGAGMSVALRQLADARVAATERTLGAVTALVADSLDGLRREAVLLARDPAIVEGAVKGDWAALARGGSPRVLAVTREGFADLVVVRDARGAPLVQVPAVPPPALPAVALANEPLVTIRTLNDRPYLLAAAPVFGGAAQEAAARVPVGTVVVGRRFESLGRLAERMPSRSAVLFVAGDRLLGATRPDAPVQGWTAALAAGAVSIGGEPFTLRPLDAAGPSPDGSLWALVPDGEFRHARRQLWLGLGALLGVAVFVLAAGVAVLVRLTGGRRARAGEQSEAWRQAIARRNRELEALNAIAVTIGQSADLVTTAEETLDVVRGVARMDVGAVYRFEADAGQLVLLAQRGLTAEQEARIRVRPLDGSHVGEAARTGRAQVTHLDLTPPADSALREMAVAREHHTQLSLPIPVKGQTWGVMALISQEKREFGSEELAVMDAVARYVGLAVERAQLRETAEARLNRLEAQRQIERHISEQLDLERLLVLVASAALRLIGGAFSIVYLREGDVLRPRAWCEVGRWIQQVRIPVGSGVAGTAVTTGRGIIVNDYSNSPLALPPFSNLAQRLVAQPLMAGDRALGVMVVSRNQSSAPPFTEDDLSTLADFATQTVVALEKARLFSEARRSAAEYQALFEVGALMISVLDVDRVLDLIVDRCRALLGGAGAGIFRLDAASGYLAYERGIGLSPEFIRALRVRIGEGTTGKAVQEREPVWSEDLLSDSAITLSDETRALVEREGYRCVLSAPILSRGEARGALAVYWWEPRKPSASEISLLTALAGQAAVALENARLYGAATARGKRLATLGRLTETLTATLSLEDVLSRVVRSAVELFGSSVSRLWLMDDGGQTVSLRAHAGATAPLVGVTRLPLGEGLMGRIVAARAPLVVPDLRVEPGVRNRERIQAEGTVSFAGVPLILGDRTLGALSVALREARTFSEEDLGLLQSLANHAAIAIENARLYREAAQQAERMRAVAELGRTLVSSFDVNRILETVTTRARETLEISDVSICLQDAETGVLRFVQGSSFTEDFIQAHVLEPGEGVAGRAVAEGRPVWTSDILDDPRIPLRPESRRRIEQVGTRAVLALPLVRERPFGALVVHRAAGHRFSELEVEYLTAFASQVAVALENARLYADTARRLAETRALLELAEILNSTLDPNRLLKQAAIKIAQLCRVDRCTIERWDSDQVIPLMSQFADGRKAPELWNAFRGMRAYAPREVPAHARAIETRRPVVIADTADTDLIPREWIDVFGLKSYMVVPLIQQGAVIGVMNLDYSERVTPFEPWQEDLAMAIAGQLALSLENTRLYGEVQERLRETSTLLAVGQALSRPGSSAEVMRGVARQVAHAFGADMVGVYELDERGEALVPRAGYRVPKHLLQIFLQRPLTRERFPLLAQTWRDGRAIWSKDVINDPRFDRRMFEGVEPHSVLLAPTAVRGEAVGALVLVWWGAGREFSPAEVRLIEGVAAQVGLATENAELARQTQRKLHETETLLSVSQTLSSTLDLETLPRQLLRHVVHALGADSAGIWLLGEDGEWMAPFVGYHVPPDRLDRLRRLRLSIVRHPFYAEAARTRQSVVSTDVMNDPRIPEEIREATGQRTHLFVPIIAKDRMIGGFAATWWERARPVSDDELRLMEAIASQAGVALENARLFRDNQRRVEELSALHELSQAITGQLDQAGLIETVHRQVARVLDVSHMVVLLHDETEDRLDVVLRVLDGVRHDGEPRFYPRPTAGLAGIVFDTGRPIRTDDYVGECARRGVAPVPTHRGLAHWLGVPMAAGDRRLGVLAMRRRERPFTEADERMLSNIAHLAALALRSARLYQERTRAFAELAAAQDQLVRTEKLRALGEMASGVAHDFNNVLASILGRAQLLLEKVEEPKLRQWLQVIERAATDGARTVRRLQDFTRIRRDQPAVAVDLNQVIQQVLEATESTWQQQTRSRGITIEVTTALAIPLPRIAGDPAELREALTNLILNAVDAMPRGGRLTLTTHAADGRVEVTIGDTGIGIPEDIRQKIFDPFFTTKGPKGTGLGLSMTYGILSRHGARVTVESEEGRGTTFRLIFPAADHVGEAAPAPPPAAQPAAPLRCLVVDDEAAVGEVLGDMLISAGHGAVVVGGGQDALVRFKADPFDIVFTDLAMPGMTGWEVARAVKDLAPAVPVALVSGFGVEVSAEDLRANGVDLVLAKPLKIPDVLSALASLRAVAGNQKRETEP